MDLMRLAAKEEAKAKLPEYLEELGIDAKKAANGAAACPVCGGGKNTPCFGTYEGGTRFKCFSCNASGDIFALYAKLNGLSENSGEAMEAVYRKYGIEYRKGDKVERPTHTHTHTDTHTAMTAEEIRKAAESFSAYILQARSRIDAPEAVAYLKSRGISLELAKAFGLGYDGKWIHPKAQSAKGAIASPRLIIPTGSYRYTARDIRKPEELTAAETSEEGRKYYHAKAKAKAYDTARAELFNEQVLSECGIWGNQRPLYVVEGELDAISIVAAGGCAIGLGSTANARLLLDKVAELDKQFNERLRDKYGKLDTLNFECWRPRLVIALDADESGEKAARTLSEGLEALGVEVLREDAGALYGGSKDANAALVADAEGFSSRIATTLEEYEARKAELSNTTAETYRSEKSAAGAIEDFLKAVEARTEAISTGFTQLDTLLSGDTKSGDSGGLMEGLYIIGAPSSCGKTTYALQMADNVAESGRDVLIFSLEMSRNELISKSLSRLTYRLANEKLRLSGEEAKRLAKTNYGISKGARYDKYSEEERKLITEAVDFYRNKIGSHIFIYEGAIGGTSVKDILGRVAEHTAKMGRAPLVIVDYLQMIKAESDRLTDKQAVDKNILALKVASREYHTPVICISSYNRDSYTAESSLSSFKESGSIEYSADVVIALGYAEMEKAEKGSRAQGKAKAQLKDIGSKPERLISLEVLKNRSGGKRSIGYRFLSFFNTFSELTDLELERAKGK